MSWGETLFLKKVIDGNKRFVGSDTVIVADFKNNQQSIFKPKLSGVITLKIDAKNLGSNTSSYIMIVRLYNSTGNYEEKQVAVYGSASSEYKGNIFYIDFTVEKKEIYSVTVGGSNIQVNSISICADIVDYNYFEIE